MTVRASTRPADLALRITLPAPLATRFAIEAERRRLSCDALAEMLLETVATDGLFAALLDD